MKKTNSFILSILFLTGVVPSCRGIDNNGIKKIDVYENKLEKVLLSDLLKSVRYVPLEYSNQSLVQFSSKLVFSNNHIILKSGGFRDAKLLSFDMNGKFIANIFNKGRANNEVINMNDFDVRDNEIFVLDNGRKRINKYSMKGEYIDFIQLPFNTTDFATLDSNNFLFRLTPSNPFFSSESNYKVVTVNEKLELIDKVGQYDSEKSPTMVGRDPYFINNTFTIPYENVMMSVSGDGKIDSVYYINIGGKQTEVETNIDPNDTDAIIRDMMAPKNRLKALPITSSNLLTLSVTEVPAEKQGFLLYDKAADISCFITKDFILDRDDMFQFSAPIAYCEKTDEFVYITQKVSEDRVNKMGFSDLFKRMSQQNKDILIGDTATSNIILVFVKFNDVKKLIEKYKTK